MLTKEAPANGHARFSNVGSGIPLSLREFAEHEWHAFGAKGKLLFGAIPVRQNEVMRFVPSI